MQYAGSCIFQISVQVVSNFFVKWLGPICKMLPFFCDGTGDAVQMPKGIKRRICSPLLKCEMNNKENAKEIIKMRKKNMISPRKKK